MISWTSLKMNYVESKTRSAGQILEKPCVRQNGHIPIPVLFQDGQNVCLDEISDEFDNGSKTRLPSQILEKYCVCS